MGGVIVYHESLVCTADLAQKANSVVQSLVLGEKSAKSENRGILASDRSDLLDRGDFWIRCSHG